MCCDNHSSSGFADIHKKSDYPFRCLRIKISGRFVRKNDIRIIQQGAADYNTLLFTT